MSSMRSTSLSPHAGHRPKATTALRLTLLASMLVLSLPTPAKAAPGFKNLHNFTGEDGMTPYPSGLLAQGRDGNLYGVASLGGSKGHGTAFKITPAGAFTKLHDFDFATEGDLPRGLTLGVDGNFYGITSLGGLGGRGTIFKLTLTGTVTVLHAFDASGAEGYDVFAPPVLGRDGNFYGTAAAGGAFNIGTVYRIRPDGAFRLLHSFEHFDGARPTAPLIVGRDGNLYGTTAEGGTGLGGTFDYGTVFKLTPTGRVTVLYTFDYVHGRLPVPSPLTQDPQGNFYGTTSSGGAYGGGTVFKLTKKRKIRTLHSFDHLTAGGQAQGFFPSWVVRTPEGNLYGATSEGGRRNCAGPGAPLCGVLFKISPDGAYSVVHRFDNAHGSQAYATPVLHTSGRLYGLTTFGGTAGLGTIYRLKVDTDPFVSFIPPAATAGESVTLLGGLNGTKAISFNGIDAAFRGGAQNHKTVIVPPGSASGLVTVTRSSGALTSNAPFYVLPTLAGFSPTSGPTGSPVILTGASLSQTTAVRFGAVRASFVVNSDHEVSAFVPAGASSARITIKTIGGEARSPKAFTVTQ